MRKRIPFPSLLHSLLSKCDYGKMSLKKIWLWKVGWVSRENNSLLSETGDDMHNDIWQMNTDEINMLLLLYADISCHAIITSMIVTINLSAVVSSIMHKSGMNDKISIWLYTRLRRTYTSNTWRHKHTRDSWTNLSLVTHLLAMKYSCNLFIAKW